MVGGTGLVRLNAEEDSRFATIVSKAWSSLRKFYPAECEIKGDVEYLDNNLQKITFMNPLAPGEYGFVVNGVMIYDFAID
jgi:hypothetical protein